ncbi:MAG: putative membrane protein [Psychromonas sp.]|jgi:uncharacterized membrane protein
MFVFLMSRFFKLTTSLLIVLNVMLVFLFFFESKVELPVLLSPLGRMHPILLHFPIGVFLIAVILQFLDKYFKETDLFEILNFLFLFSALTAALTAIFGFFLGLESGYDIELLKDHKRLGILTSLGCWLSYLGLSKGWKVAKIPSIATLAVMTVAGHLGGEITHGEDYVLAPIRPAAELTFLENESLYDQAIFPILKAKCLACHNNKKQKGELNMASLATLVKGGEEGPIWEAGSALNSHLISNANLPIDDKMHMPPKGKPQLTSLEIALLSRWIDEGADTNLTLSELQLGDTLRTLVQTQYPPKSGDKSYDFNAVSSTQLAELNTPFCTVNKLANGSAALQASFFVSQRFHLEDLKRLSNVSEQLVSLNLSKMPLEDKDLGLLSSFQNLEKLILNYTNLTGEGIEVLAGLKQLKYLSLTGIPLEKGSLSKLSHLENLRSIYVWNTGLDQEEIEVYKKENPSTRVYTGFKASKNDILKINSPILVNKDAILEQGEKVEIEHGLMDVEIRYTLDGSIPDSIEGLIYEKGLEVNGFVEIKAIATKKGWYRSDIASFALFQSSFQPDSAWLTTPTHKDYPGKGIGTIFDGKQGDKDNFRDLTWLGFLGENAEIGFKRKLNDSYKGIIVSYLKNAGSSIMPPLEVELWAGDQKNNLRLIQSKKPELMKENGSVSFDAESFLLKNQYKFYKIICKPLLKLPSWHTRKGDKSWIFIDEVYFY